MIKKMTLWKIFNFIAFVYCISVSMSRQEEYGLFFLPLIYSVLFTVCFRSRRLLGKTPGVTVIMGVMFLRYVILPIVLYSSGELSKYANSYEYMAQAIAVMIYEMIAIFAVLELSTTKSWRVYEDNYIKYKKNITVKTPIAIQSTTMIGPTIPIASTSELSPPITVIVVITTKITAPTQRGRLYS